MLRTARELLAAIKQQMVDEDQATRDDDDEMLQSLRHVRRIMIGQAVGSINSAIEWQIKIADKTPPPKSTRPRQSNKTPAADRPPEVPTDRGGPAKRLLTGGPP